MAHLLWDASNSGSCAHEASAAPSRLIDSCVGLFPSWKSRRHVTRLIEGRDWRTLSERRDPPWTFLGMMGLTVKRKPQPFTEPSLLKVQDSSSPTTLMSWAQSDASLPDFTAITAPLPSLMTRTSCLRSVEQRGSKLRIMASAPGIRMVLLVVVLSG